MKNNKIYCWRNYNNKKKILGQFKLNKMKWKNHLKKKNKS